MKLPYQYSVDETVLHVFSAASRRRREELIRIFDFLAREPFTVEDSIQRDHTGRRCCVKRFGRWSVTWWAEHLANQIHILHVEQLL